MQLRAVWPFLTQHFEHRPLALRLLALGRRVVLAAQVARPPDPEAHAHVEKDHDRHGDDEEEEGGGLEEEARRGQDGAEGRLLNRLRRREEIKRWKRSFHLERWGFAGKKAPLYFDRCTSYEKIPLGRFMSNVCV